MRYPSSWILWLSMRWRAWSLWARPSSISLTRWTWPASSSRHTTRCVETRENVWQHLTISENWGLSWKVSLHVNSYCPMLNGSLMIIVYPSHKQLEIKELPPNKNSPKYMHKSGSPGRVPAGLRVQLRHASREQTRRRAHGRKRQGGGEGRIDLDFFKTCVIVSNSEILNLVVETLSPLSLFSPRVFWFEPPFLLFLFCWVETGTFLFSFCRARSFL